MAILSNERTPDNLYTSLSLALAIFELFFLISLDVNLSLNHTLLIFFLYVTQTWKIQLILANSLQGLIFFNTEGLCLSYAWSYSL